MESVKPLAWAAALSDARKENFFRDDPRGDVPARWAAGELLAGQSGVDAQSSADAWFRNALSRSFSGRPGTAEGP